MILLLILKLFIIYKRRVGENMVLLDIGISISFGLMLLFFSRSVITENIGDVASSMEKERFFVLIGTRARE